MTTTSAEGPARAPTPRPKGPPKAPPSDNPRSSQPSPGGKGGESGAGVGAGAGARAGAGVGVGAGRRGARTGPPDPLSDKATAFLVRRTLCPQHLEKGKSTPVSIDELLPPLTSRNDVDLQLYALIAIILREFVQNWYNKITPDEAFVAEIVQTIAHITRALEQRLRKVDLESLLFDELPDLLDKHITAYRAAHDPVVHHPLQANPQEIYHSLHPLPALTPIPCLGNAASIAEQAENEVAYRQLLVHGVLAVLLPTEDLENECLTALVGQIFSELIIGNAVANKLSEPWLIYEVLCIASRVLLQRRAAGNEGAPGKLSSKGSSDARSVFSVQALFWTILQWCFLATSFIRTIFTILIASRSVPPRSSRSSLNHDDVTDQKVGFAEHSPLGDSSETGEAGPEPLKTPVLAFRCWAAISNLIEMDVRMPWLRGTLSLLQWIAMAGPGRIADVDGKLDR
ncbi:PXA domain-containing protein [Lasiosphaeria hispida]|uniref:PXA domain-containing protein n=1 Tax=Lasiosphaeria hispida TaxID=260671 RepID=A0AAJ0HM48_9PEZI|nr:PXA domain-containing protein [Lasiosphaeria hispida]